MSKTVLSRETLLPPLAAHVLQHGLGDASLRPLAQSAGTSDQMLLHHFGSKERLMADLLSHLADIYSNALDAALAKDRPATRQALLESILTLSSGPALQPFLRVWWEIVAGAARGQTGYREAAAAMMARQVEWLESQMPAGDPDPAGGARYLSTLIEGALMMEAIGQGAIARDALLAGDTSGH